MARSLVHSSLDLLKKGVDLVRGGGGRNYVLDASVVEPLTTGQFLGWSIVPTGPGSAGGITSCLLALVR